MKEGMVTLRSGICKFIRTGSIGQCPGSGRPSEITAEIKLIVDEQMRKDDETSAFQLHALLLSCGHYLSIRTILRCRTTLSWTFCGTAYCQLIASQISSNGLNGRRHIATRLGFLDVVWSDSAGDSISEERLSRWT